MRGGQFLARQRSSPREASGVCVAGAVELSAASTNPIAELLHPLFFSPSRRRDAGHLR